MWGVDPGAAGVLNPGGESAEYEDSAMRERFQYAHEQCLRIMQDLDSRVKDNTSPEHWSYEAFEKSLDEARKTCHEIHVNLGLAVK